MHSSKQDLILPLSPSPSPSPRSPPGVPDGGDGIAELAVDAATVIELLVGRPGRALVLDAADAANAHDEDDQHQDEGDAERADDDVQGVPGHVGETLRHVTRLPLQVWGENKQTPGCETRPLEWEGLHCPCFGNLNYKGCPNWEEFPSMDNPDQGLMSLIHKGLLQTIKKNQEHAIEKWAKDIKRIHRRNTSRKVFSFIVL